MNNNNQQACPNCRHMNPANTAICELCGFIYAKEGMTITYCPRAPNSTNSSADSQQSNQVGNENETIAPASFAISDDDATIMPEGDTAQAPSQSATDPMAHFKIFDVLGKGGMGAIYKAQDLKLERFVALKLFYSQAAANSQTLLDEARFACKLNHPNIVTIYDIARGQNSNFIVMEWVDGQTLNQVIPKEGLPVYQALDYACQIVEGLACAHQNGIIHRDIKPQNIMLNKEGRIKILDFGIAELLRQSNKASKTSEESGEPSVGDVTRVTGLSGTPKYMAPEQARGEALDQRADIFSFGILLYEMLTGSRPFEADNLNNLKEQLENRTYRPLKELCPQLSNEMVELVDKMLAPMKEERWQTSEELSETLKTIYGELTQPKNWWQQRHWLSKAAIVLPFMVAVGWSVKEIVFPPTTQELVERQVAEAKKIAVLPLDNISGDPVLQLFSDGLITTLSSDLAAAGLEQGDGTTWVIPSSEIRRMKEVSVRAVSDKFGVDLVVSG
ncbi:MAG: serine/threonine-protein kinase, partial [Kangiellaceae bacterium]|nr:serine/threonine-protein kinase [Kangiellaceae bacterium]